MIDFACAEFPLREVVKCSLNLTRSEMDILYHFLDSSGWKTTQDVAGAVGVDLTTAQRAAKKMTARGVLEQRQHNLEGGGYQYVYRVRSRREVQDRIIAIVHDWARRAEDALREL